MYILGDATDLRQRSMGQSLADGDSHQRKAGIRMYCLRADPLGGSSRLVTTNFGDCSVKPR